MKDAPINQCDGCRRGDIIVNGYHRDERGHPYMTCTAKRYAPVRAAASAEPTEKMHLAYNAIDCFLRNNLDDSDYATYSEHLETLWPDPPAAPSPKETPAKWVCSCMGPCMCDYLKNLPERAEPLLPRECRHCFVRCADCPEPAEPPPQTGEPA